MAIQQVPGLFQTFSLADVMRNAAQTKMAMANLEESKLRMDAFRKSQQRQGQLQEIMSGQGSMDAGQPAAPDVPASPLQDNSVMDIPVPDDGVPPSEDYTHMGDAQPGASPVGDETIAPEGPTQDAGVPRHIDIAQQLIANGFTAEAQELMKPHMDQFKALGDFDKNTATEYYNANIAPLTGQYIDYSEPEEWTTPKAAIDESTGQPVFFSRNKRTGVTEAVDGFQPMPKSGWQITSDGQGGFSMTQGPIGKGGFSELTKPVLTQAQKDIIKLDDEYEKVMGVAKTFRPEFLQIGTRLEKAAQMWGEKLGAYKPEGKDKRDLEQYADFRRNAIELINSYIKSITGAAMSEKEAERIRLAMPDPGEGIFDGDSPTQFQAKLNSAVRSIRLSRARRQYLIKQGFSGSQADKMVKSDSAISLGRIESIIKEDAESIYNTLKSENPTTNDVDLSRQAFERAFANYGA